MHFTTYQRKAMETAIYPGTGGLLGLAYAGLGLSNEAGEVGGKIKKIIRDIDSAELTWDGDRITYPIHIREAVEAEVGDVVWYIAAVCHELGIDMGDAALGNLEKLADRANRGVLKGSGDNR